MRDEDKPFVLYRRGPWNFNIVPRGRKGWMMIGLFLAAMLVWTIAMIRSMQARSEVVDVGRMLELKREQSASAARAISRQVGSPDDSEIAAKQTSRAANTSAR